MLHALKCRKCYFLFFLWILEAETIVSSSLLQGTITNILEENVVQPVLVTSSAISLAAETVRSIMKIDDIVSL